MSNILMIVSGADALTLTDGTEHPTGFWAEELAVPHRLFRDAGIDVDIADARGQIIAAAGSPRSPTTRSVDRNLISGQNRSRARKPPSRCSPR